MKEIKFKTSKGEFLVVDEKDYKVFHLMLTMNGPEAISLKNITEEQASEIVDKVMNEQHFQNYNFKSFNDRWVKTAIESLHSLLKSKGIHLFQNPIPEPEYQFDNFGNGGMCENWIKEYQEQETKTFYNPYIFKLND